MCQNPREQQKWIADLNKLHRQLTKVETEFPPSFSFLEIYDPQVPILKGVININGIKIFLNRVFTNDVLLQRFYYSLFSKIK